MSHHILFYLIFFFESRNLFHSKSMYVQGDQKIQPTKETIETKEMTKLD
jgi:hypothetical protein